MNELEKKLSEIADKHSNEAMVDVVMVLLADMTDEDLKECNAYDLYHRLALNFCRSNTKEDIDTFIKHKMICKLLDVMKK